MKWWVYILTSKHFCKCCICHFYERKQPALRRCGPDRNAVSASSITPDTINGKSLLDGLILAFANVPCSQWHWEPLHWQSLPLSQRPSWNFCFCIKHFLCCFTPSFQLKSLSLNPHKPILGNAIFLVCYFCFFNVYIFKDERTEEAIFAALPCKCQCMQDLSFKMFLTFEWKSSCYYLIHLCFLWCPLFEM